MDRFKIWNVFSSKAVNFISYIFAKVDFSVYLSTRSPVAFGAFHSCLFSPFQFNCLLRVFKLLLSSCLSTNLKYRWYKDRRVENT